jgi:hypothetical protein
MRGHFAEFGKNGIDLFVTVDESDNQRQLAACLNQMRRSHAASTVESSYGMECRRPSNIFLTKVL